MNDEPDDITREIFIAATPDTVFGFLIDPALIMKWIGISHQLEPRPGGIFRVEISAGNIARGIYTQVIRPHRVAFTWGWETHAADLMALADLPPGASFGGDRSHTEGRRNSIAIPSQPPTESIVEIARRTVVYLSRPPQNRGFRPCSRRTARCNQHVARDLISGTQASGGKKCARKPSNKRSHSRPLLGKCTT